MVESLRELNRICQKPRYKEAGNWMVRHIVRDAALPLTWLLLHTPVTANQVTLASLILGLAGIALFAFSSHTLFLWGTLLLQFWYYLDHVDGQIARYRGTASLTGRFFDFMVHHAIHGAVFFSLGFYVFQNAGHWGALVWGFVTSMAILLFNLIHDTKYKVFFEKLDSMQGEEIQIQSLSSGDEVPSENTLPPPKSEYQPLRRIFSFFHKISEIHVLMNLLTLAALWQVIIPSRFDFRSNLFCLYGVIVPALAIFKIAYLIKNQSLDHEFRNRFHCPQTASRS